MSLVHTIDKEVIVKYIESLNNSLINNNYFTNNSYYGFSVGVSKFDSSKAFEVVLKQADEAMYACKKNKDKYYNFFEE